MGTKGGNCYRLKGKHLSVSLVAIIGTTILLWAWEKTPLVTTLLSAQDQFVMPSSETLVGVADPLLPINPKEYSEEDSSGRETKNEQTGDDSSNVVMSDETKSRQTIEDSSDIILSGETKSEQTGEDSSDIKQESHILEIPHAAISGETKSEQTEEDSSDIKPKEDIDEAPHAVISEETNSKQTDEDPLDIKPKEDIQETPQVMSGETKSEQTEERLDVAPISSVAVTSHKKGEDDNDLTTASIENKACNYAKGKWVADSRRPLYSGFGCKQWLSPMWACRLTQRTDFSYEAIRWQPENCKMPEFERMAFLKRMQDRTIAFVGDSLGRQQFQSLMCMAAGGEERPEVEDIGRQYGLVKTRGAKRPDGWAYRFPSSNTTILYYWSATLCDLEPLNITDPSTDIAMHLDRPAAFLRNYLHRFDVLVLNTGHHWNRGKLTGNRWVMYVGGMPNTDRKRAQIGNAKNFTVYSVTNWVDAQLPKHPRLKAFFRTISPRHFVNGDWNTGGSCDNTSPLAGGSEVSQDESSDPVVADAVKNTKVKILDITAISQLRDEGHISRYSIRAVEGMQDCLHWCLPGIPDTWNELLVAQIYAG